MWKSIEDPPSTDRDVIVYDGEVVYVVAFYDHSEKTWRIRGDMFYRFEEYVLYTDDIKLWCEIPKLNE